MAQNDLITVALYMHNVETYIKKTINSILANNYKNIELLIIDDASTDNSVKIVNNLLSIDNRIIIIKQNEYQGRYKSLSLILDKAKGAYIIFFCPYDSFPSDAIDKLYIATQKLQTDITIGSISLYNEVNNLFENNDLLAYTSLKNYVNKIIPLNNLHYNMLQISHTIYGKLYKTSFIKENNISFSKVNGYEEIKFLYSLLFTKNIKITFIDEEVYSYHHGDIRMSKTNNINIFNSYEDLKQLAIIYKSEVFLCYARKYLTHLYEQSITKSIKGDLPLVFFKTARKYLLSGDLNKQYSRHLSLLNKSTLMAYYWAGIDKKVIKKIINGNALSCKLFNIIKAIFSK